MATTARCCFLLLILGVNVRVECLWNFRAVGEYLTGDVSDCKKGFSVEATRYFEEVHYSDGGSINKTAFLVNYDDIDTVSFFGDLEAGRVFLQMGNQCENVTGNDPSLPRFNAWAFRSEAVYAPTYTILTELQYRITETDDLKYVVERGLPAVKVPLNLDDQSDKEDYIEEAYVIFEGQGGEEVHDFTKMIPLTVEICLMSNGTRSKERLSIMEFAWNVTVEQDASPAAGIQCDGYGRSDIPNVFDASTLVLRTEQVLDGNVTTADIALDFDRKLLRIDNGVHDYFLSTSQKVIYNVANPNTRVRTCDVMDLSEASKLPWTFVSFSVESAGDFFGVDEHFKIKTRTKRRGIDCDLVSGRRTDYLPEKSPSSVWEWCIADVNTAAGIKKYIVHLDIFIDSEEGRYQESYSLYDTEHPDQKTLYLDQFTELEPCFDLDRKRNLQVMVDSVNDPMYAGEDVEFAVESGLFKAALLDKLLEVSGLSPDSYRFGSTDAVILGEKESIFQFYIFDAPKNSPESERLDAVFQKLQGAISDSALDVDVNGMKFAIRKGSLKDAQEIEEKTTLVPVTDPYTQSLPAPSTTIAPPTPPSPRTSPETQSSDSVAPTTEPSKKDEEPDVAEGYNGALIFGIASTILIAGVGVGIIGGREVLSRRI
ncbi:uncharacterized protein LOC100909303 [Galendromus occidentalis]|uniref:Uncharacterized protein LOC100909303 n=1 Tax=Galendromus occidentalis TaxID=34638 RepID=A0AAJ6VWM0_9ACAR|nr:uncharacterized protein LOC100909303 [Galendromus occidentalis]